MLLAAEERLKAKIDAAAKDPGVTFENTGIDYICIDEAHLFKNLRTLSSIPGAAIDGSMRASDLDMKLSWLREHHGRRVTTLATATPIANSVTESARDAAVPAARTARRSSASAEFDSWAATFGQTVTEIELAPEGGTSFRQVTRFAKFQNIPEMLRLFFAAADIKTSEDLHLPVPAIAVRADGQRAPETVQVEPSDGQEAFIITWAPAPRRSATATSSLTKTTWSASAPTGGWPRWTCGCSASRWTSPARSARPAGKIAAIWQAHRDDVYPGPDGQPHPVRGSLQIVFCDLGTPRDRWNVYDELRAQLELARGLPRQAVRFIHEAATDQAKGELFAACRAGNVAVLVGTTAKMGVGTNVQARAVALHHLDAPWRPADVAQREGRILRQGNLNGEVQIIRYVTESSFDGYMWQTLERKAKFIAQIMRGQARRPRDRGHRRRRPVLQRGQGAGHRQPAADRQGRSRRRADQAGPRRTRPPPQRGLPAAHHHPRQESRRRDRRTCCRAWTRPSPAAATPAAEAFAMTVDGRTYRKRRRRRAAAEGPPAEGSRRRGDGGQGPRRQYPRPHDPGRGTRRPRAGRGIQLPRLR